MVKNLKYDVQLLVADKEKEQFCGTTEISFELEDLPMDAPFAISAALNLTQVSLNGHNVEVKIDQTNKLELPKEHLQLKQNVLVINYIGRFTPEQEDGIGLYRTNSPDGSLNVLYTQCEPDYTKMIFPVFEVLRWKAKYRATLIVKSTLTVVANEYAATEKQITAADELKNIVSDYLLKCTEEVMIKEGPESRYKVFQSNWTPPFSYNLFALTAGNFHKEVWPEQYKGREVSIYCVNEMKSTLQNVKNRLLNLTLSGLKFFEDYFNQEMIYSKYEQVFLPNFSFNGMENPGCITLNDKNLENIGNIWTIFNRDRLLMHELAHMWFGNLVTMDEFHNIWLKEAIVEYLAHVCLENIIEKVNPAMTKEEVSLNFVVRTNLVTKKENPPFTQNSYPLCFRCENYLEDLQSYYSLIVYQKGSSFMRGLDLLLGGTIFRDAMRLILQKFYQTNYNDEDFKAIVCEVIDASSNDESHSHSAEVRKQKFLRWFEDHVHVKGYTHLVVTSFENLPGEKAIKINITANHAKFYETAFRAYGFDGQLIREFFFNPKPDPKIDISDHVFIQHEVSTPVAILVPNVTYGSFMKVELDETSLRNLFNKHSPLIHRLPLLERAVIYNSFLLSPKPRDIQTLVHAAALVDDSPYINELFGIKTSSWNSNAWRKHMEKQILNN